MPTQSRSKNSKAVSNLSTANLALLRVLTEQQAAPIDQLARLLGSKRSTLRSQAERLEQEGWLVSDSFSTDRYPWLRPTSRAASRLGTPYRRHSLSLRHLNHHRGMIEARIELSQEFPEGRWVSESAVLRRDRCKEDLPDGEFELDGNRWAIEVELSWKSIPRVRNHVDALLRRYDKVIYFCTDRVLRRMAAVQAGFPAERLQLRQAKAPTWLTAPQKRKVKSSHRVTPVEVKLLRLITEEGAVAIDQLAELTGAEPAPMRRQLAKLERHGLLERGFRFPGSAGWVWCTYLGTRASGTSICPLKMVGPSLLHRRRAMMSVRLLLMGPGSPGRWLTRRMLSQGIKRGIRIEMAVLEHHGCRFAVMALPEAPTHTPPMVRSIERLASEYDAVWCYCASESKVWATRQLLSKGWKNVEVKDLPPQ